jgi:beta-lactamase regulating signal transducer with metallopeptidase domain
MSDAWIQSGIGAGVAITAWLATYAIHSTVLLLVAWFVARVVGDRPAITSAMWKVAAVGGIVTASLSSALAIEPLAGRVEVEVFAPQAPIAAVSVAAQGLASAVDTAAIADLSLPPIDEASRVAAPPAPQRIVWPALIAAAWLVGVAVALVSLACAFVRLGAILRTTRPASAPVRQAFTAIVAGLPTRRFAALLESDAIVVPFATGVLAPIIVVPACAASRLSSASLRTMLAHELAHVLRRDPTWRVVLVSLERVFFFQPLLRLARRGLEHDAEYLCDAWAATRTAAPLELARCLTEIASWVPAGRRLALATTMAEPRSILRRRVLRLVAGDSFITPSSQRLVLLAIVACGVLPFVAPVIASADARARAIVIRVMPDGEHDSREITILHAPHAPYADVVEAPPPAPPKRAETRARKQAQRETTRELRRTIRRARRDDRLPTADELAAVLGEQAVAPHITRVDDMVIVVDAEAIDEARAIAVELDAIIAGSAAVAEAARANALRRRDQSSRTLEQQARALRQRAAAHREAARALRMRIVGEESAAPMLAPLPPAPPAPPMPPWHRDIVPAVAPPAH